MKLVINSEPSVVSNLINDLLMRRGQILERTDISAGNINQSQIISRIEIVMNSLLSLFKKQFSSSSKK